EGKSVLSAKGNTIESDVFAVTFDPYGNIKSLIDKRDGKEYCGSFMNKLNVYKDKRLHYNAWDIDIKYTKKAPAEFKLINSHTTITDGAVVRENMYKYGSSSISQKVILAAGRPLVDFVTTVDWQETHKMLRADFRPAVFSKEVTCDIQLGNLKRSTSDDTKVEKAQFEICAHKWIDLSEGGRGISVLTDCKYGYRVKEGLISLNLLRSPMFPAPDADKGMHTICYALCPHSGDYNEAEVQRYGYLYNNRPLITEYEVDIPAYFVSSDTHIVVETVKRAENGKGVVVRAYEDSGSARTATITTPLEGKVYETDLLENVIGEAKLKDLEFKPFEIRTFLIEDREGA
ncbi:MAG: alpha-mannosidase, partial [Firmicutes bacterium]|nr:alpha-mannosidase [Candidatus Stercoripulliclostridium pullicola]